MHKYGSYTKSTRAHTHRVLLHYLLVNVTIPRVKGWPLHGIVIANTTWCIAYKREVGRGVVHCPIIVQ